MINNENYEPLARSFQAAARKERTRYLTTREKLFVWRLYAGLLTLIVIAQSVNYYLDVTALRQVSP